MLATGAKVARRNVAVAVAIRGYEAVAKRDNTIELLDPAYGRLRVDPCQKADLAFVNVAPSGHQALIQKRLPEGSLGITPESSDRLLGIPVGPQQVGAEPAGDARLVGGGENVEHLEAVTEGVPRSGAQYDSDLVRTFDPAAAPAIKAPGPIHHEVGMDAQATLDAHEEVLAVRRDPGDGSSAEIQRGVTRHPKVAAVEHPSRQRVVERCGRAPDRVAFRHLGRDPWK